MVQNSEQIVDGIDLNLSQPGEQNPPLGIFSNRNWCAIINPCSLGKQQIPELLVIDLQFLVLLKPPQNVI